jgi:hypothetical protein
MGTLFLEQAANSEFIRFGHTPRHNSLSAHTVFKLLFPLQHQDPGASLGHRSGQCGRGDSAPYCNDVVTSCRHHELLLTWAPRFECGIEDGNCGSILVKLSVKSQSIHEWDNSAWFNRQPK